MGEGPIVILTFPRGKGHLSSRRPEQREGRKDLGQLRFSEARSGLRIAAFISSLTAFQKAEGSEVSFLPTKNPTTRAIV
jgi:hypothetical protein